MSHVDTGPRTSTAEEPCRAGGRGGCRPIPTLYRLPWLLLIFAPWYLKHFMGQPYRRLPPWENLRQLLTDPKRRHRIALYDGVMNFILNGYGSLCRRSVSRRAGRMAVAFARLAFAFDDEYESRCARGDSLAFDEVFTGAQVQQPLHEWREFMRPLPTYPAIRSYLERFVRSLYMDYTAGIGRPGGTDDFGRLLRAATLDSGGFLRAVVHIVALSQGVALDERVCAQFAALGVLGKAADDMIDFGADGSAARPNLLRTLVAETPLESAVVGDAWPSGARMNTVWWRRHCPATFTRYAGMCVEHYATLDTVWLRLASHLMWVPALLGRATTKDVRGRL